MINFDGDGDGHWVGDGTCKQTLTINSEAFPSGIVSKGKVITTKVGLELKVIGLMSSVEMGTVCCCVHLYLAGFGSQGGCSPVLTRSHLNVSLSPWVI